jgi:three-Cys-motif partner protein
MVDNFFNGGFDTGTKTKLEIYNEYLKGGLPVYLRLVKPLSNKLYIYDFFSGPGKDSTGANGSPLILLNNLCDHCWVAVENKTDLKVLFNDKNPDHAKILGDSISVFMKDRMETHPECRWNSGGCPLKIDVLNKDFKEIFPEKIGTDPTIPKIIFIDQYGYGLITDEVLLKLALEQHSDVLLVIDSNQAHRFSASDFNKKLNIPVEEVSEVISKGNGQLPHLNVLSLYKHVLKRNSINDYYLAPFSIKNEKDRIHGLIFGSRNLKGLQKFLDAAWKIDDVHGSSNHNVFNDINLIEDSLFQDEEAVVRTRFRTDLRHFLKFRERTNREIYQFTLEHGFLPKHAKQDISEWNKKGYIEWRRSPVGKWGLFIDYDPDVEVHVRYTGV